MTYDASFLKYKFWEDVRVGMQGRFSVWEFDQQSVLRLGSERSGVISFLHLPTALFPWVGGCVSQSPVMTTRYCVLGTFSLWSTVR